MNYTWKILRLGLKDELNHEGTLLENAVVEVKWKRTGVDTDGVTATYVGNSKFSAANTAAADFTSHNDLTNAQVIEWLENAIEPGEIARIEAQIARKIERNRVRNIKPNW